MKLPIPGMERLRLLKDNLVVKRFGAILGIDILVKLSSFLLLPVYLRLMTQEEYGLYGYLLSIILTFSVVLNFGLYIPLSKLYHDYSNPQDKGSLLFTLSITLLLGLFCLIFPVYYFGLDYRIVNFLFKNQINYNAYRYVVLLAVVISVGNFMLTNFFFTSEKIGPVKRYNMWRLIGINVVTLAVLFMLPGRDTVQLRLQSTYIVEALLFLLFAIVALREMRPVFSKTMVSNSIKLALPVMLSAILGIFINFSDKFFLEKYNSFTNLSPYYLAISIAGLIPLIYTSFQNVWLPLFLKEKDIEKNAARTNKLIFQLSLVFLGLSLLMVLALKICFMFGIIQDKYYEAIFILPILLLSQIIASLVSIYTNYLVYFGKTYITPVTGIVVCSINVGLNILLIPKYGPYGAAFVSLISNVFYLGMYYIIITGYIKKHSSFKTVVKE